MLFFQQAISKTKTLEINLMNNERRPLAFEYTHVTVHVLSVWIWHLPRCQDLPFSFSCMSPVNNNNEEPLQMSGTDVIKINSVITVGCSLLLVSWCEDYCGCAGEFSCRYDKRALIITQGALGTPVITHFLFQNSLQLSQLLPVLCTNTCVGRLRQSAMIK